MFHTPYQNRYDSIRVEYNEEGDVWDSVSAGFAKGVCEEEPYEKYSLDRILKLALFGFEIGFDWVCFGFDWV